ncbi:MAG TPA: gamma-glutamylcyclotransferase family protein [Chthoniobacterales bacterium]
MGLNVRGAEAGLLACYGTLRRRGLFAHVGFRVAGGLRFWGYGRVRGCLHWQAFFPALVPGRGLVAVEVYRVDDKAVLNWLDRYEGFDPGNTGRSVFVRRRALLEGTSKMVWLYCLNRSVQPGHPIRFPARGTACFSGRIE